MENANVVSSCFLYPTHLNDPNYTLHVDYTQIPKLTSPHTTPINGGIPIL